jgi:acyl carrier protein
VSTRAVGPGRVRAVICERPEVAEALVFDRGRGGYCAVVALSSYCSAPDLREHVTVRLGEDALPDTIVIVPAAPEGTAALSLSMESAEQIIRSPDASVHTFIPPRTSTEKSLAEMWRQLLARRYISTSDEFADLGGDSLSAVLLLSVIEDGLGVTVPLDRFLAAPSIKELAVVIDAISGPG